MSQTFEGSIKDVTDSAVKTAIEMENQCEKKQRKATIVSVIAYITTDLAVTAICSFTLTPYMLSFGLSSFTIIMSITFISFIAFGLLYSLFNYAKDAYKKRSKNKNTVPKTSPFSDTENMVAC